jgi:micrococcal nuclease
MDRRIVVCLVVLAGCSAVIGPDDGRSTVTPGDGQRATVEAVVDGDTVDVRYPNGTTERVRLLGVDTPELGGENAPDEFEGVPDTEDGRACLRAVGERASEALRERVAGEQVSVVVDPAADRRGGYGRLLAYLVHADTDLNRWLVETGYARVFDTAFSRSGHYYEAQAQAQADGRGVWDCRPDGSTTG